MRKRQSIPPRVEEQLLFETHRTCCICQKPGRSLVLHHINSDPSNNNLRNLAVLCHECHDEAHKRSSLSHALTPRLVRKFRDDWLQQVRSRRASPTAVRSKLPHEAMLETLAVHEIRKVHSDLMEANWGEKLQLLKLLNPYTDFRYGYESRTEFLNTLSNLASETRMGMTYNVACMVANLTKSVLPIFSLVRTARTKPKKKDIALLQQAVSIGSDMAHDAAKFLQDIGVAAEGAEVLWGVLRFAHLNKLKGLKKEVLDEFHSLEKTAKFADFTDGKRWFEFECLDALALESDKLPPMPADIAKKLLQLARPTVNKEGV